MIATVLAYTEREGTGWIPWPWGKEAKPSNPELLTKRPTDIAILRVSGHRTGAVILMPVHALMLDNGVIWDSVNGFRKGEGPQ